MMIPKAEKKDAWLTIAITPSLDRKIRAFAKRNKVTKSEAARFILERFFDGSVENSEATPPKNEFDFEIFKELS